MKQGKKAVLISFLLSALGFGTLMVLLVNFWNPVALDEEFVGRPNDQTLSQAQSMGIATDKSYLAIYFTLGDRAPHCFFVLGHDPAAQTLTVQQVAPNLVTSYRGENLPMAALHKIFGVRSVEAGIENALNIDIAATIYADREGMHTLFGAMGNVDLYLTEDIQYEEVYSQNKFQLTKGQQSLSPAAVLSLLNVYEKSDNWDQMSNLLCEIIRQKGSVVVSSQRIPNLVFDACETNMSGTDLSLALPELQHLFSSTKENVILQDMAQ